MFHLPRIIVLITIVYLAHAVTRRADSAKTRTQTDTGPGISFLNVDKVWNENKITGKNIVVAVLDDGLNYNHLDLSANYNKEVSYDFVDNDTDPSPAWFSGARHGTNCAGIIAAKLDGSCRTGIAYEAKVAGIRIFGKSTANKDFTANGLGYNREKIDIYSNSWGTKDSGYSTRGPTDESKRALENGAIKGRKGLGSVFVFSSGNGGLFGDSCAFDGYINSIYTLAIGAVTKTGKVPHYAEPCSSILASTYGDKVKTSGSFLFNCDSEFGKTSGAAAFASGIIALLLEANNKLTWRDVQHLIVRTSNPRKTEIDGKDWTVNGAGLMAHPYVGFGVMNAKKLVDVAQKWINVPKQLSCSIELAKQQHLIIDRDGDNITFSLPNNKECSSIRTLEHVQVEVSLSFFPRAHMLMYLISPKETKSQLLYYRVLDAITQRRNYKNLVMTSLHFWGENPSACDGKWRVLVKSAKFKRPSSVKLDNFKITFYGTEEDPISYNTILPRGTISCQRRKFWRGYGSECCGSSGAFDTNDERCCSRTNKIVEKRSLCGKMEYNKCEKRCCEGKPRLIIKHGEERFCCGRKSYSKTRHVCCGRERYNKFKNGKELFCCGNESYSKMQHVCCGGKRYKKFKNGKELFCCGKTLYSKTQHVCCGRNRYIRYPCKWMRMHSHYGWYWVRYIHQTTCVNGQPRTNVKLPYRQC